MFEGTAPVEELTVLCGGCWPLHWCLSPPIHQLSIREREASHHTGNDCTSLNTRERRWQCIGKGAPLAAV